MKKGLYRSRAADPTRQALIFQLESGADVLLTDEKPVRKAANASPEPAATPPGPARVSATRQWADKARDMALKAKNLDELREAIAAFEGLDVRKTATQMVFCDGHPKADVMIIGEAPGEEEDLQGKPFVGRSGRLLDKILESIGLSRKSDDPKTAFYISNVLNWRPPGNRTPTPQEMEIARPFIERHIALAKPKILLFAGAVAAQTLLPGAPTLSKCRGRWIDYKPLTEGIELDKPIPAYALYHPAYLLRSPLQKKKAWHDMLAVKKKLNA